MRISDWSSDVCSSDLLIHQMVHDNSNAIVRFTGLDESIANRIVKGLAKLLTDMAAEPDHPIRLRVEEGLAKLALDLPQDPEVQAKVARVRDELLDRSEEHTSELQSLMRISYAVFRLKKKITCINNTTLNDTRT